jgi:hypothetical protein
MYIFSILPNNIKINTVNFNHAFGKIITFSQPNINESDCGIEMAELTHAHGLYIKLAFFLATLRDISVVYLSFFDKTKHVLIIIG